MLKIEGDNITAIEVVHYLDELRDTIDTRGKDDFLSPAASAEKRTLIDNGCDSDSLSDPCKEFFGTFPIYG